MTLRTFTLNWDHMELEEGVALIVTLKQLESALQDPEALAEAKDIALLEAITSGVTLDSALKEQLRLAQA